MAVFPILLKSILAYFKSASFAESFPVLSSSILASLALNFSVVASLKFANVESRLPIAAEFAFNFAVVVSLKLATSPSIFLILASCAVNFSVVVSLKFATSPSISPTFAVMASSSAVLTLSPTITFKSSTSLPLAAGEDKLPVIIAL